MEHVLISYHYTTNSFYIFIIISYYSITFLLLYFLSIIYKIILISLQKIKSKFIYTLKTSTHSPRLISNDVHTFSTILERIHRTYFGEVFICILGNCCPYQPTVIYHLEGIFGNAGGRLGSWLQDHCRK